MANQVEEKNADYSVVSPSPANLIAGARRKNGHKLTCGCHICENIRAKVKRGGYSAGEKSSSKKKNGHKESCRCVICKNIMNAKSKTRTKRQSVKRRRGSIRNRN
jgi:hypothetical protein